MTQLAFGDSRDTARASRNVGRVGSTSVPDLIAESTWVSPKATYEPDILRVSRWIPSRDTDSQK